MPLSETHYNAYHQQLILPIEKIRINQRIELANLREIPPVEDFYGDMVYSIECSILREKREVFTKPTPVNWWEHFKQDCMPKWFLKRFPVVTVYQKIDASYCFPEYKLLEKDLGRGFVTIHLMETIYYGG